MLEVLRTNYSGNHPVVARTYDNIGSVLDDMGRFEEALELLHQSLDIKMSAHKKDDQDVAHTQALIAAVLTNQEKYQELDFGASAASVLQIGSARRP